MPAKATISRTGDQHVNVYEWQNDTISVLVTGEQTGGALMDPLTFAQVGSPVERGMSGVSGRRWG